MRYSGGIYVTLALLLAVSLAGCLNRSVSEEPEAKTIAVFPFFVRDDAYQGVADEIVDGIEKHVNDSEELTLWPKSEMETPGRRSDNHDQWSKDAGVTLIVEGGISRRRDEMEISVQILDGETADHAWYQYYSMDQVVIDQVILEVNTQISALSKKQLEL